MEEGGRRRRREYNWVRGGSRSSIIEERVPSGVVVENIIGTLDLESILTVACVSRTLRSYVSQFLSSPFPIPLLDLSFFSPDAETVNHINDQLGGYKSVTLDCLRLDNPSVTKFLGGEIQELNLLKCAKLSDQIFTSVGQICPKLRTLALEFQGTSLFGFCGKKLSCMLNNLSNLESLCIKIRGTELDACHFQCIEYSLPKTIEVLKLKPMYAEDVIRVVNKLKDDKNVIVSSPNISPAFALKSLSFLVDYIDDGLIILITKSLPHLIELDLEDRPIFPNPNEDLTNNGLQSLGTCQHLSTLSLVRSRQHLPLSFKRVNDMGMFLLSECCKGLRSIKLGGFSKVSDAGFSSILQSCRNLEKFEVRNAPLLSDLAFHNIGTSTSCSLIDVKLLSCGLVTSDTVIELSSCFKLEVLNLSGCKSIADGCLNSISSLSYLTTLNLEGADVTDNGMAILGRGFSPISNLCLRNCKRISDKGVSHLLSGRNVISTTLTSLDIGYISGISDDAVSTIAAFGLNIIELSMRYCFSVTGITLKELGSEKRFGEGKKLIRRLDLYHCLGLSVEYLQSVKKPLFRGLRWLGVGCTQWDSRGESELTQICEERPWMTLCLEGCELGCIDGWHYHK